MKHLGTQTLETERLILRRFTPEDVQPMFDNWASDEEVTKYLTWPAHASVDVTRKVLDSWLADYEKPDYYNWAIVLKECGQPVGSIVAANQDDRIGKAHIGYCMGKRWWHRGIMSEALGAVMEFLFHEVGMLRLEARHDPNNPHSGAVMRKCGMKYEGTLRQSDWNNRGICDACWYAALREEWKKP